MPSLVLVVPGRLQTRTGGYGYDGRIVAGLRAAGWSVSVAELDPGFPRPTPAALEHAACTLAAIPDGTVVLVDGLALGAMPIEAERESRRLRLVAIVHHPLALETGLDPALAARLELSERRALAAVRRVVVTSRATARTLAGYGVDQARIAVVEPGTDAAPLARGSAGPTLQLLAVASIVPRKGHEILVRALARVSGAPWRLVCAGSLERDPAAVERVRALVSARRLGDRVALVGEQNEAALGELYDAADLFVLPTLYEGYGMAVAEAVARGLPIVATATGAIVEFAKGAGLFAPPGDEEAFAEILSRALLDARARAALAEGARRARERLPSWDQASRRMAEVVSVEI